jgi:hypothetical protein
MIYFMETGAGAPPATDPLFASVVLLLGFQGADASTTITDESTSGHTFTAAGNAQIDTAQYKWGSSSGLLDGAGDLWSAPDSTDWYLEGGDANIGMWVRLATVSTRQWLCGQSNGAASVVANVMEVTAAGKLRYLSGAFPSGTRVDVLGTTTLVANTWHWLEFDKNGNNYRVFVDGNLDTTVNSAAALGDFAGVFSIGRGGTFNNFYVNGHIGELRITKASRNTASFTPPTAPLPRS